MVHHFTPYPPAFTLRSQLFTQPPSAVPPVEDLLSLQEELNNLKNKSLARSRKAENDLKTLEGLLKKHKDKEKEKVKGKAKDKVKVKREATGTVIFLLAIRREADVYAYQGLLMILICPRHPRLLSRQLPPEATVSKPCSVPRRSHPRHIPQKRSLE